jgi:hypothetical protein
MSEKKSNTKKDNNDTPLSGELGGTAKEIEYYGFLKTIASNYGYTILFLIIIVGLIFLIQYAQKKLNFPESKMIVNWFGFIIVINVIITYGTIMMYKQVKNQKGYIGSKGVHGPIGDQGSSEYCDQCASEIKTVQPIFAESKIKQPLLPETINTDPVGLDDEDDDENEGDDGYLGDDTEKEE